MLCLSKYSIALCSGAVDTWYLVDPMTRLEALESLSVCSRGIVTRRVTRRKQSIGRRRDMASRSIDSGRRQSTGYSRLSVYFKFWR
jgi:hypothetical protein